MPERAGGGSGMERSALGRGGCGGGGSGGGGCGVCMWWGGGGRWREALKDVPGHCRSRRWGHCYPALRRQLPGGRSLPTPSGGSWVMPANAIIGRRGIPPELILYIIPNSPPLTVHNPSDHRYSGTTTMFSKPLSLPLISRIATPSSHHFHRTLPFVLKTAMSTATPPKYDWMIIMPYQLDAGERRLKCRQ